MTSEIESCKGYWYTPLYENEQKWERKTPMETTKASQKLDVGHELFGVRRKPVFEIDPR